MSEHIIGEVVTHIENFVADVRLSRPDKLNALTPGLMSDIVETAAWLKNNPAIRCIVLSGEGRAFCAGLDMSGFENMVDGQSSELIERTHGIANFFQQVVWGWRECQAPVIAAIKGVAIGGGFQVALGADVRFVHPETKMSVMEMKWGLIPDMAGVALMHHLASEDIVRELTYSARMFNGIEAHSYGFATHVTEAPHEDAMTLAKEIASKNPDAIRAAKIIYNDLADDRAAEVLMQESVLQDELLQSDNQIEAVTAALEKRPANFKN